MPWTELATATLAGTDLRLYGAEEGAYMIRANGLELMSSRNHGSEDVLGRMAGALARECGKPEPRILVGGLGLGYTLAAAVGELQGAGHITVAEISPDVIAWYERHFEPALFAERPRNLRIASSDVASLLRDAARARYDVIVLDVDNGPRALAADGNDYLYGAEGLAALHAALAENGIALVWSGFEAPEFASRAATEGFAVARETVGIAERPGLSHYIYRLTRIYAGSS